MNIVVVVLVMSNRAFPNATFVSASVLCLCGIMSLQIQSASHADACTIEASAQISRRETRHLRSANETSPVQEKTGLVVDHGRHLSANLSGESGIRTRGPV